VITVLKYWPILVLAAGLVATTARTEVALSYATSRIEKLEERQLLISSELQRSIKILQLNVARICVKVEAGCRE
tara:strand:- start:137 stop:358 length:222 start_codon:yes stop_codon:yes gene_type:complete